MKKILFLLITLAISFGCDMPESAKDEQRTEEIQKRSIKITPQKSSLRVGESIQLKLILTMPDGTKSEIGKSLWEISDAALAEISSDGLLKARQVGDVSIIAKYEDLEDTLNIKILKQPAPGGLKISEVFYDAIGIDSGSEYIEILNSGNVPVVLNNYCLVDGDKTGTTFIFPDNIQLNPGEFLVVAAVDHPYAVEYPQVNFITGLNISLNNSGETIFLKDSDGVLVDSVYIEGGSALYPENISWGESALPKAQSSYSVQRDLDRADTDSAEDWFEALPTPGSSPN